MVDVISPPFDCVVVKSSQPVDENSSSFFDTIEFLRDKSFPPKQWSI